MTTSTAATRVGVLWRGDPGAPTTAAGSRLYRVFEELEKLGIAAEPVVFAEEVLAAVRTRLLALHGVLVWVDPLGFGRDRSVLDALLREVAAAGVFVSAHPDVILKMGTKDVLVQTKDMAWGSDTYLYTSSGDLRDGLLRLLPSAPRVLKQHRGNGGEGIWKVALADAGPVSGASAVEVLHAARGSSLETMALDAFIDRCALYFAGNGCVVDQPYQERLGEGMVRCYMVGGRVAGFGHQFVTALLPPPPGTIETPAPPPRLYYGPDKPQFQELKHKLESGWIAEMQRICGVDTPSLPVIWDADFLLGPKTPDGEDTYVLCEINISSVFPVPDECFAPMAAAAGQAARREGRP